MGKTSSPAVTESTCPPGISQSLTTLVSNRFDATRQVQKSTPSIIKGTDTLLFIYLVFNVVFKHTGKGKRTVKRGAKSRCLAIPIACKS